MNKDFEFVKPEKVTGYKIRHYSKIPAVKRHNYLILDQQVSGDAPKSFIKHYEYGIGKKINPNSWPTYIAKTGHKWYPNESITEQLLTWLGQSLGINMAESKLRLIGNQLRFMSKYFLLPRQQLIHGAEIYYGYFENDHAFVDEIENKNEARNLLTLQLTRKAIETFFPDQCEQIVNQLVRMLLFDAWIGNNDRHFYNWGIIRHIYDQHIPFFSPVYDTARGLFWNYSEEKVVNLCQDPKELDNHLIKYSKNSKPKIGWDGIIDINHFQLVRLIYDNEFCISKQEIIDLFSNNKFQFCLKTIETDFRQLMSQSRIYLIKRLLTYRQQKFIEILN